MKQEKYEQLKSIIQQANPDIVRRCDCHDRLCEMCVLGRVEEREIRLADVLLAMRKKHENRHFVVENILGSILEFGYNGDGVAGYYEIYAGDGDRKIWNLRDDNLDHQSEETKQFLIDLLCQ